MIARSLLGLTARSTASAAPCTRALSTLAKYTTPTASSKAYTHYLASTYPSITHGTGIVSTLSAESLSFTRGGGASVMVRKSHDVYHFGDEASDTDGNKQPWKEPIPDLVPNTGSVARDHLAAERTFLAWARTGLTFVALGVGITSVQRVAQHQEQIQDHIGMDPVITAALPLPPLDHLPEDDVRLHLLGLPDLPSLICVATGASFLVYAAGRYFRVQRCLIRGTFPINRVGIIGVMLSSSLMTLAGLALVFTEPRQFISRPRRKREAERKRRALASSKGDSDAGANK